MSLFFHPPHHAPACISPGEAAGRERERKVGRLVTVSPPPAPHTRVNFRCASFIDSLPPKKSRSWTGTWWICASQMVAPPDSANIASFAVFAESGCATMISRALCSVPIECLLLHTLWLGSGKSQDRHITISTHVCTYFADLHGSGAQSLRRSHAAI